MSKIALFLRALRREEARWRLALERARRKAKDPKDVQELRISSVRHPIWLRAGGSDYSTFLQVFLTREYEHGFVLDPKLIIDAGANIGLAAVFFANKYPDATILAIEPEETNFSLLLRNTVAYPSIRCLRGAVWPQPATLTIANETTCENPAAFKVRAVSDSSVSALPCFTPLSLLELSGRCAIDIFKIDIEGAELELFSIDSELWLNRVGMILAEIHDADRPGCGEAFFRSVCTRRFEFRQRSETTTIRFLGGDHASVR